MARVRKKIGEATSLGDGKCVLKQLLEKHGRHAIHLLSQMRQPGSCSLLLPFELKWIPRFISDHASINRRFEYYLNLVNLVHSIRAAPRRILPWTGTRSSSDWRRPVFRMVQIWDLTWLLRVQYKERNAQIWAPESDDEQEDEEEANKIEKNSFSCLQGIHQVLLSTTFHLYHEASLIIVICTSHHISLLVLFISIYDHNFLSERVLDWACVQKRFVRFGHSAISHANQFVRIRWWMQEALETEHPVEVRNAWRPPESTLSVHTSAAPIGVVWCG